MGQHRAVCFCITCRSSKVARVMQAAQLTPAVLHRVYFTQLTRSRETILDMKYQHTLEEIVMGYSYKRKCLASSGYTNFGSYMNARPEYAHLNDVEKLKISDQMTQVTGVFEQWDSIVENLTRPSMFVIEARGFSIYQFYRAINFNWCIRTRNSLMRSATTTIENHEYDDIKFQELLACVRRSGILVDVSHSREQARLISKRFGEELQQMCTP